MVLLENEMAADSAAHSTATLVARLRKGDASAGKVLDDAYREALVRFCWGYLHRLEEAEDAVQDIWQKVLISNTIPDAFRPWLYRLARNHCLNLLRDQNRHGEVGDLQSNIYESLTGPLTRIEREENADQLARLVIGLPENLREVLRLRYIEDLPRPEIAEVLQISESTVKSRLFQAMRQLRELASLSDQTRST